MREQRRRLRTTAAIAVFLLAACGSKTGLIAPDADVDAREPDPDASLTPICLEVPPNGEPVSADFTIPVTLAVVDVFFLIDATASMVDEIGNVRNSLRGRVVPGVRAAIPDAAFGVSFLGEFPFEPHGPESVRPYELRVAVTQDIPSVEAALTSVPEWGNFDDPEAQVEALYQVATGDGLGELIAPLPGCPMGGEGGVCFRRDSLPVVMLITDAPFHDGPGGSEPYEDIVPRPHDYEQTVAALRAGGIFVIGLGARDVGRPSPLADLRSIARDTGAVRGDGSPLAFDIGSRGDEVGSGIVDAVQRLAAALPLDVDAVVQDVPGDSIDARTLVREIRAVRAVPDSGAEGIDGGRFVGVSPGTRVTFEIVVDASDLPPMSTTLRVPARVTFRAFGRSRIGETNIVLVIVGEDGLGCDELAEPGEDR